MRALLQRVSEAQVSVDQKVVGQIGRGLLILLGAARGDSPVDAEYLAQRCASVRIFDDTVGKMNLSLADVGGSALVVSQFTLYADTRRGNRPSFSDAAPSEEAERLYDYFISCLRLKLGENKVSTGMFRANMNVGLVNEGPVTVLMESKDA